MSLSTGSGTLITTAIVGCVFAIKDFRLDRLIFVRDIIFYGAAVSLLFYIFTVPGRIRLRDSVYLLGLYFLYVMVVLASKYFTKDRPLKNLRKYKCDYDLFISCAKSSNLHSNQTDPPREIPMRVASSLRASTSTTIQLPLWLLCADFYSTPKTRLIITRHPP